MFNSKWYQRSNNKLLYLRFTNVPIQCVYIRIATVGTIVQRGLSNGKCLKDYTFSMLRFKFQIQILVKTIFFVIVQVTKCAAGGRDHLPCCLRRGVPLECQALCQGTQIHTSNSVYGDCFAYIGNIMACLEEGKYRILKLIFCLKLNSQTL